MSSWDAHDYTRPSTTIRRQRDAVYFWLRHESEVVVQQREASGQRAGIIDRMIGAARLQVSTFEDVEADRSATRQAMLVVIVVAVATGIGSVGGGVAGLLGGVAFCPRRMGDMGMAYIFRGHSASSDSADARRLGSAGASSFQTLAPSDAAPEVGG